MSEVRKKFKEVPVSKLRWKCPVSRLDFSSTKDVQPSTEIIGQKRALRAIRLGLDIESPGYNIYVAGFVGTGRNTTIKRLLEELDKEQTPPDDLCYVHNFRNPDMPTLIALAAARGKGLRNDMNLLIETLQRNIPLIFENENYQESKKKLVESFKEREKELLKTLEKQVEEQGFVLAQVQTGPYTRPEVVPVVEENPVALETLEKYVEEGKYEQKELEKKKEQYKHLSEELEATFKDVRKIEKEMRQQVERFDMQAVMPLVKDAIGELIQKYADYRKLVSYFEDVEKDIIENIDKFKPRTEQPTVLSPFMPMQPVADEFLEYRVNVLVDNSDTKGRPVIIETTPNHRNLFGAIERVVGRYGEVRSDFTRVKAGSLLRANGGYLVLNALDVLIEPGVWYALKRTIRNRIIELQPYDPFYLFAGTSLKPEPVDFQLKIVMIGDAYLYHLLYTYDEDFKKMFKIKADFDTVMPRSKDAVRDYARFIARVCSEEGHPHFDKTGIAAIAEYGARLAGNPEKLTTRFLKIVDIAREACYWALKDRSKLVEAQHVEQAINEKVYRVKLVEEKIQELIERGVLMIDIDGKRVGQVNGLSIYDLGYHVFGRPSKITSQTSMGRAGIINIEREANLSGSTHDKGVLILTGYIRAMYARHRPLTLSASLCFEQSYTGVEGDSASTAELFAFLSSLSEIPLRQDIAVTGSVNQKGEVQPIGGVNEKIEGFFDVCKAKGLTGKQGVIIPGRNVDDLMLRTDVVEAVRKGKFHVYPIMTVEEGIEILTGMPAGKRRKDGTYLKGTVNFHVDRKLTELSEKMKKFSEKAKPEIEEED
ncbi:MAG: ATP-dependent protease [Latescibacteria bacterium DG_63]|nr:MAG: ATP-dependent protease [Latescibacteria bacterium DG_63]